MLYGCLSAILCVHLCLLFRLASRTPFILVSKGHTCLFDQYQQSIHLFPCVRLHLPVDWTVTARFLCLISTLIILRRTFVHHHQHISDRSAGSSRQLRDFADYPVVFPEEKPDDAAITGSCPLYFLDGRASFCELNGRARRPD